MFALFLPHRCFACLHIVPEPSLCPSCLAETNFDGQLIDVTSTISMVAAFEYRSPVGKALKRIKRLGLTPGVHYLATLLIQSKIVTTPWPITYIPSPAIRVRRRGVDIARILAQRMAANTKGPVVTLLTRDEGGHQAKRTRAQRLEMDTNLFTCTQEPPREAVLLDDVRTTGKTTLMAAKTLVRHGCSKVLIATLLGNGLPTARP